MLTGHRSPPIPVPQYKELKSPVSMGSREGGGREEGEKEGGKTKKGGKREEGREEEGKRKGRQR